MASDILLSIDARLIEVILFLENQPVSIERFGKLTGMQDTQVRNALEELDSIYHAHLHGLELVENNGQYHLLPCGELHDRLRDCYGRKVDRRLSKAALESLSIIAYAQPITRREVENIRGVASDNIIRLLRERDYIKVVGRKDIPGHPSLYGTTRKFLFEFNLPSIAALPQMSDIDRARFSKDEESLHED